MNNIIVRKCPICEAHGRFIFTGNLMEKYKVSYYQCPKCAFVYTEDPYWLEEAYQESIAKIDTGIMQRNMTDVLLVNMLIELCFKNARNFLDWGGGYGIFTRMMRDLGYNWVWYDKYSVNYLAKGFEYICDNCKLEKIDFITGFELLEHFDNPKEEIQNLFAISENVLFSTEIYNDGFEYKKFEDWWYYTPQTGQHISFYSKVTMEYLAKMNNVNYYKINDGLHLFTKSKIDKWKISLLDNNKLWFLPYYFFHKNRRRGLAVKDMEILMRK